MKVLVMCFIAMLFSVGLISHAFAHETRQVEQYKIEVGWETEPPIVGHRNAFTFEISEPGDNPGLEVGVKNAFKNLDATAKFGGVTKLLNIDSDPKPGSYLAKVIPTKVGTYSILLKGDINGVPVDLEIPVDDAESTAVLDFPPTSGGSSDQDVIALKGAVSSLEQEISSIKKSGNGIEVTSEGSSYDYAFLGLSLAAAAIILSVIALVKRK